MQTTTTTNVNEKEETPLSIALPCSAPPADDDDGDWTVDEYPNVYVSKPSWCRKKLYERFPERVQAIDQAYVLAKKTRRLLADKPFLGVVAGLGLVCAAQSVASGSFVYCCVVPHFVYNAAAAAPAPCHCQKEESSKQENKQVQK